MGCHQNIDYKKFPTQGEFAGSRTKVCFNYQSEILMGTIVRDDAESPGLTIIRLDDGRHILSTECQYSPLPNRSSTEENWPDVINA